MAQILGLKSLREIEHAQKIKQKRLCHLGVKSPVSRSALSRMNDERSADFLSADVAVMQGTCARLTIQTARGKQPDSDGRDNHPFFINISFTQ